MGLAWIGVRLAWDRPMCTLPCPIVGRLLSQPLRFPPLAPQVSMVSPVAQAQLTLPVSLPRPTAREELVWLALCCRWGWGQGGAPFLPRFAVTAAFRCGPTRCKGHLAGAVGDTLSEAGTGVSCLQV